MGDFLEQCPVLKARNGYRLCRTAKECRLAGRRREELTEVFREWYQIRGGIEKSRVGKWCFVA